MNMNEWCRKLGIATGILGTIGSFVIAYSSGQTLDVLKGYQTVRNWPLTIGIFAGCMFSVVVLATILFAISSILDKLAELEYDDDGTSFPASHDSILDNSSGSNGSWVCECGKRNPSYTGTCSCGRNKPSK